MDSPYPVKRVALIKSTNGAEAQDRYATHLKEHEFISFSVPTLTFQFQLDDLKECLMQPEKYSGLQDQNRN